jgi:hypothetical protein
MFKNVAGQKIALFAFNTTTNAPVTGDAANLTAYVSKDGGAVTVLADTSATQMDATNAAGWYQFDVSQSESNADWLVFTAKSSTANVILVGTAVYTRPANFTSLGINSSGRVAIQSGFQRNAAAVISFPMRDTTSAPLTGSTVTVSYAHDVATSFTTVGTATEKANGFYHVSLSASQMNAATVLLRFSGSGGSGTPADNGMTLYTDP